MTDTDTTAATSGETVTARLRLKACVAAWPECESGGYDPRCCRFPKSCSCEDYEDDQIAPADLETAPWEQAELVGQRLNADLHAAIGHEPCDTACTHLCIPEFSTLTMLGFANSFARAVERHLTHSGGDAS